MNEQECLSRMIAPGTPRARKWRNGVIQVHVTRACDLACLNCTQGSQLGGKLSFMTPPQFEVALLSLKDYFGVVGVFGGNPATSPHFAAYCDLLTKHIPLPQRGLWCNHPRGKGSVMRRTFNPGVSNLNVHLSQEAFDEFKRDWPESMPFGLKEDSRHSPPYVAMQDVIADEGRRWELISNCDINKHWSSLIGVFRGQLRAWFCEIAGAQAMLHQEDPSYPDTGIPLQDPDSGTPINLDWWRRPMQAFAQQVRHHCHACGVPLRGYGELAQAPDGTEQVSATHADIYQPKRKGRRVELVQMEEQLGNRLQRMTDYIGNSKR